MNRYQALRSVFAIITTNANELVRAIHDRMPVIIAPIHYDRWLSPLDPDPRDLLVPFPSEPMTMWPISTRVNKPENDDASILDRVEEPVGIIAKLAGRNDAQKLGHSELS